MLDINTLLVKYPNKDASPTVDFLTGLGYDTVVYGWTSNAYGEGNMEINDTNYAKICEELKAGAYAIVSKSTPGNANGGHKIALYGINDIGEVLVMDSDTMVDRINMYDDGITYHVPLQNITGPTSDIIIVKKRPVES